MKKLLSLILVFTFILSFAACSKEVSNNTETETKAKTEDVTDKETTDEEIDDEELIGGDTQIPNPMVELSEEEYENSTNGTAYIPEDATDIAYYSIESSDFTLYEIMYTYAGADFIFRYCVYDEFATADDETLFSGYWYDSWEIEETIDASGLTMYAHFMTSEDLGFIRWYENGVNYCLCMDGGNYEQLIILAKEYLYFYSTIDD